MSRLVAIYCAQGPYRHVRDLLDSGASWLPWGYRTACLQDELEPAPGDEVELWEVDDVRVAEQAEPICVASVDFISRADGYLAFTLRPRTDQRCLATASEVVAAARGGSLLADVSVARPVAG